MSKKVIALSQLILGKYEKASSAAEFVRDNIGQITQIVAPDYNSLIAEKNKLLTEVMPYREEPWTKTSAYIEVQQQLELAVESNKKLYEDLVKKDKQVDKLLKLVSRISKVIK